MKEIYLDNSSTTELHPEVQDIMIKVMREVYGNPASLHKLGYKADKVLNNSRAVIADFLNCSPNEIIFTSGGTEANNLAIQGVASSYSNRGKHLITTATEHASVYEVYKYLETKGYEVTYLKVDKKGILDFDQFDQALRKDTILVSIIHVNNETGNILPVKQIGDILKHKRETFFHVDAVQSFGKIDLDPKDNGIDLLTVSGHKINGPKGIAFLYKKESIKLDSIYKGGEQELTLRPGTPSLINIAGLAKAIQIINKYNLKEKHIFWSESRLKLIEELSRYSGFQFTDNKLQAPYILNFSFRNIKSEPLVNAFGERNIYISSKSACSSKSNKPSRILLAIGCNKDEAENCVRLSMGFSTSSEDINKFISISKDVIFEVGI